MKAAWDWHLPRETDEQARAVVEFASELGFDTLVVNEPTAGMIASGDELGIRLVSIVTPNVPETMAASRPHVVQRLAPSEEALAGAMRDAPRDYDLIRPSMVSSLDSFENGVLRATRRD